MTATRTLPFVLLLAAGLCAQAEATTLFAQCAAAPWIVVARTIEVGDPTPGWHRVVLRPTQVLRGDASEDFAVLEPAGRCCGRALADAQPGADLLLFLERRGPALHPLGGGRAVLPATPARIAHVAALLAAPDDAARAALLVASLGADDERVRADAALALPTLPNLALAAGDHAAVLAAAVRAVDAASALAPALLAAAVRTARPETPGTLLASLWSAPRDDAAGAVQRALLLLPPPDVVDAVAMRPPTTETECLRAARLLATVDTPLAVPLLDRLLTGAANPRVALAASEGLLAHGTARANLQGRVPAPVLDEADRRQSARPVLRYVRSAHR